MAQSTPYTSRELLRAQPHDIKEKATDQFEKMADKATDQFKSVADQAEDVANRVRRAGPRGRRARAGGGRQPQGRRRQVGEGPADGDAGHGRRGRLRPRRAVEVVTSVKRPRNLKGTVPCFGV